MNGSELTATLHTLEERFNAVEDAEMKASLQTLLNLVETLAGENARLREENQHLKDEINRLKGEQGKPTFSGRSSQNKDFSSEQERRSRSSQQKTHSRQRPSKREYPLYISRRALAYQYWRLTLFLN